MKSLPSSKNNFELWRLFWNADQVWSAWNLQKRCSRTAISYESWLIWADWRGTLHLKHCSDRNSGDCYYSRVYKQGIHTSSHVFVIPKDPANTLSSCEGPEWILHCNESEMDILWTAKMVKNCSERIWGTWMDRCDDYSVYNTKICAKNEDTNTTGQQTTTSECQTIRCWSEHTS